MWLASFGVEGVGLRAPLVRGKGQKGSIEGVGGGRRASDRLMEGGRGGNMS